MNKLFKTNRQKPKSIKSCLPDFETHATFLRKPFLLWRLKSLSGHQRALSMPKHSWHQPKANSWWIIKGSWINAQLWDPTMGLWASWALSVLWPRSGHVRVSSKGTWGTALGDKKGSGCEGAGLICLTLPLSTPGAGVYFPSLPHTDRNIDLVSCNISLNHRQCKKWTSRSDSTLSTRLLVVLLSGAVKTNRRDVESELSYLWST